jgi:succinate dehydrogenase/fumarate reductase flavoprotein subunit
MLKTAFCSLALAVLLAGLSMTPVDAKAKKRVAAATGCTASALMRDESRFWACQAKKTAEVKPKKRVAVATGCTASALMRDESRFWACQPKK